MAESTAKVTLDLDNAEFVKKLKESLGLMANLVALNLSPMLQICFLKSAPSLASQLPELQIGRAHV